MSNITSIIDKSISNTTKSLDFLLTHLFADKKTVYIDDINFNSDGGYSVSYCFEYTLKSGYPQWLDATIARNVLIELIYSQNLNHWESFRYDHFSGTVQPHTNIDADVEGFLDDNYQEVIKTYLEQQA